MNIYLCAINNRIDEVKLKISEIKREDTTSHFVIVLSGDGSQLNLSEDYISKIATGFDSFWSESMKIGLSFIEKEVEEGQFKVDRVIFFNEDFNKLPGFVEFFDCQSRSKDILIGKVVGKDHKVLFGPKKVIKYFKPLFEFSENPDFANFNWISIPYRYLEDISWPSFRHAFSDYFVSFKLIKKYSCKVVDLPVGSVEELLSDRRSSFNDNYKNKFLSRKSFYENFKFYYEVFPLYRIGLFALGWLARRLWSVKTR